MEAGFVNRRSGVQSPQPAPRFTAENPVLRALPDSGTGGIDGADERSCQTQNQEQLFPARSLIDSLLARAFAHSPEAARKARLIATAVSQWPNKTPANQSYERPLLLRDLSELEAMMRGAA